MMDGEEVKDFKTLAKVKSVEEMIPKPSNYKGRAQEIGESEYKIIEECLKLDGTVEQACALAGISVPSYYKHREKSPEFARRMDIARQFPRMVARAAIQKRIRQGDARTALEYLKLRDKFYKPEVVEEGQEEIKTQTVQFISVPSNEGQKNTNNLDTQMNTRQELSSQGYSNTGEKMTPRENEEQALRNLSLLDSRSE